LLGYKKLKIMKNLKNYNSFINESISPENEVVSFIKRKMMDDKKEYRGHIPTKYNKGSEWNDSSWLVDEILMFINKEHMTSYTLMKFSDKYDYDTLDEILKNNFQKEYEDALSLENERNN
jgi:hypothetical protein